MGTKKNLKRLLEFMENCGFETISIDGNIADGLRLVGSAQKTIRVARLFKDKRKKKERWEMPLDKKGQLLCVGAGKQPCTKCSVAELNKLCVISDRCVVYSQWVIGKADNLSSVDLDAFSLTMKTMFGK